MTADRRASPAADPRNLVLGTAGHIDHGKTALVRALTGVDCDRLPEEKARGITIELGFAPLELPGGAQVSIVDVPGHEGLVRTMVSGATGIDLVLVVVAADEGVMPQTREHVAICDLLGLTRGVAVITKTDAVDEDVAGLAAEELRELLSQTSLAGIPIHSASARTGEGVDALRAALAEAAAVATPRTPRLGPPRLAIDRAFAMKGFGSIVTGTLIGAPLTTRSPVEIYPSGLRARIRGLESHGVAADRVAPGARCAANLQGVEIAQLSRGDVVSAPDALSPTVVLDARVQWLDAAPPARDGASVALLAGTTERLGRLRPIGASQLEPGGTGFVRIHLEGAAVPLLPGDPFILRGFARIPNGGATLGGGVVLDVAPARRRRSDPSLREELEALGRFDAESAVAVRIERSGLSGIAADDLRRQTGLAGAGLERILAAQRGKERAVATHAGAWLGRRALEDLEARALRALARYHEREPLRPGMPRGALRGAFPENVAAGAVDLVVERLVARGRLRAERELVRLAEHRPALRPDERRLAERIVEVAREASLAPPSIREWAEQLDVPAERLVDLLAHLAREGALVRAPGDLFFDRDAVDALRARIVAHLREHGALDTQGYKSLIGTTRRFAAPRRCARPARQMTRIAG
jgi:selenocysteine-specific elongation factor